MSKLGDGSGHAPEELADRIFEAVLSRQPLPVRMRQHMAGCAECSREGERAWQLAKGVLALLSEHPFGSEPQALESPLAADSNIEARSDRDVRRVPARAPVRTRMRPEAAGRKLSRKLAMGVIWARRRFARSGPARGSGRPRLPRRFHARLRVLLARMSRSSWRFAWLLLAVTSALVVAIIGGTVKRDAGSDDVRRDREATKIATGNTLYRHAGCGRTLALSPDRHRVVTAGCDNAAIVFDIPSGQVLQRLEGDEHDSIWSVAFSPDGLLVATGSDAGKVRIWNLETGQQVILKGHSRPVRAVKFSPDQRLLVSASEDWTATVWRLPEGRGTWLEGHDGPVMSADFNHDGSRVVTTSADGMVRLWSEPWQKPLALPGHEGTVFTAAFSPDGLRLATGGKDGTVRLWDVTSGQALGMPFQHSGPVTSAVFKHTGAAVLTTSSDKTSALLDTGTGALMHIHRFSKHTAPVTSSVFSADERCIATAGEDDYVRIWDAQQVEQIDRVPLPAGTRALAFAQGDTVLVAVADDGKVHRLPGCPKSEHQESSLRRTVGDSVRKSALALEY